VGRCMGRPPRYRTRQARRRRRRRRPPLLVPSARPVLRQRLFSFNVGGGYGGAANPRKRAFVGPDGPYGTHPDDGEGGGGYEYGSKSRWRPEIRSTGAGAAHRVFSNCTSSRRRRRRTSGLTRIRTRWRWWRRK
jgi:hypothetical protein